MPTYTFENSDENSDGQLVEIPQSVYEEQYFSLLAQVEEFANAQAKKSGQPPLSEDPVYQEVVEMCRNPALCTQESIFKVHLGRAITE